MNLAARLVPLFALLAVPFCVPAQALASATDGGSALDQFRDAYRLIRERYVKPLDDSKLMHGAIKGLVKGLDPHSEYLDAQGFRTLTTGKEQLRVSRLAMDLGSDHKDYSLQGNKAHGRSAHRAFRAGQSSGPN